LLFFTLTLWYCFGRFSTVSTVKKVGERAAISIRPPAMMKKRK